jgi:hypothetical protein
MRSTLFIEMAPVMMLGKRELVGNIPTACTDGINEKYSMKYISGLDDKELGAEIMHENFHKLGRHLNIYKRLWDENRVLANLACDMWNDMRIYTADPGETLVKLPKYTQERWDNMTDEEREAATKRGKKVGDHMYLFDLKYQHWSIPQIFRDMKENPPPRGDSGGGQGGDGEGSGEEVGTGHDEHDWEAGNAMTPAEQAEIAQQVEDAIRQGIAAAKKAGLSNGKDTLGLQELLAPTVNWKDQLKDFVRTTCRKRDQSTWRRPRRKMLGMGVYLPSRVGSQISELVAAVDASGSMMGKPMQVVMSELEGLAQELSIGKIHLIYWDGWVTKHEEYIGDAFKNWRTATQPAGGGGTNPACVAEYLREKQIKPDAVVVLTDGEVLGWGEWEVPVLWAIYNPSNTITAPVGKTIHVKTEV